MIEVISKGMRDEVVALSAHGKVSHEDYATVVIPQVEEKLKAHAKVRLFFHLGNDFLGYTAEAIWDDTKIGIQHLTAFEKIAVVTDVSWVREVIRFFRFIVPCPVKLFSNNDFQAAAAWINQ